MQKRGSLFIMQKRGLLFISGIFSFYYEQWYSIYVINSDHLSVLWKASSFLINILPAQFLSIANSELHGWTPFWKPSFLKLQIANFMNNVILWQKEATLENDISRKWAKAVCHVHWHQCNIMMSWLKYLSAGWVFLLQLGLEVEYAKSNLKTSLSEIWVICHLLPFVRVGQYSIYTYFILLIFLLEENFY